MKKRFCLAFIAALVCAVMCACSIQDIDYTYDYPSQSASENDRSYSQPDKYDISDDALAEAEQLVEEDGVYTTPAMVAAYIYKFNKLPSNFITKKEAEQLGWKDEYKYLDDAAPGMSIGGDSFSNREGLLPKGKYRECDINYSGGNRGAERIVYTQDCENIYYTQDHYNTYTQLY